MTSRPCKRCKRAAEVIGDDDNNDPNNNNNNDNNDREEQEKAPYNVKEFYRNCTALHNWTTNSKLSEE